MNIDDLWIGDILILKKSGRAGRFEGIAADGKLRVKLQNKTVLTSISNVEEGSEKDLAPTPVISNRLLKKKKDKMEIKKSIDLHIEVLQPSMARSVPEHIIDYQIKAARKFIENSIQHRTRIIEIIHGKGTGVLKSEVHHLLSMYTEVEFIFPKNQGGSVEVWLKV